MKSTLQIRLLASVATFSALAFALAGAGCGGDVTGTPDGAVAANTEETNSESALSVQEPAAGSETTADSAAEGDRQEDRDSRSAEERDSGRQPRGAGIVPTPMPPGGPGADGGPGQNQGGRRQGGMMRGTERLLEQLELTDAQKEKIKAITEDAAKQFQALREQQDAQQGSLREKFQQIRDATMKKIEAVLTPEQRAKFKKLQEEAAAQMRERMREQGGSGGQPGPGGSGGRQGTRAGG